jgi:CelD/BcsL family acetyltransferase involved in cellulose biosynthesis
MVDAAAQLPRSLASGTDRIPHAGDPATADASRGQPAVAAGDYARLVAGRTTAPAQTAAWVDAWSTASGHDTFIVNAGMRDATQVLLPLETVRRGPFTVARFMGGSHAAGNFPAALPGPGDLTAGELARAVRAARPDVDLLHLERLCRERNGQISPLAALPQSESPNVALAVCLDGGFEALLDRASGKRKRKKHRSQTRKFEAAGGFRRLEARTPEEVDTLLAAFFDMKAERFRRMGIADVFAPAGVRAFLRALFVDALAKKMPPFVLHGLEVGGVLRAITGSSRSGDRLICEFGAIAEDGKSSTSPGEFLFYENIREACAQGFDIYDFSVGDEPYKRLWCNIETRQFDLVIPVSAKGHVLAVAIGAATRLKRAVKRNRAVWTLVKRLRRQSAPTTPAEED